MQFVCGVFTGMCVAAAAAAIYYGATDWGWTFGVLAAALAVVAGVLSSIEEARYR